MATNPIPVKTALRLLGRDSGVLRLPLCPPDEATCDAVTETRAAGGHVIAVGTTAVRALETASRDGTIVPFSGETDLFVLPGYDFRSVDAIITNFHLPQSSLLMLVAAFAGRERVLEAYEHAVSRQYRFFSYGDSMFITPGVGP